MKTIPLGNSGVDVSAFCLGTMYFGNRDNEEISYKMLDQYVDAGGFFLDTANIYTFWLPGFAGGESETLLGKWIKDRGNRSNLFISTKVGLAYPGVEFGLKPHLIESECEKSLKRLGIETIDLFYAHIDDRNTKLEETMEAFNKLIKSGKVRFIGASNFVTWRFEEARWISKTNGFAEYCCIQQRYSYIRPKPGGRFDPQIVADYKLLEYCKSKGITLLAYSPLLGGAYTRKDRNFADQYIGSDTDGRVNILKSVAVEVEASLNQVVYAWMILNYPPVIPLLAASTTEQMQENLGALNVKLNSEQLNRLNNALTGGAAW